MRRIFLARLGAVVLMLAPWADVGHAESCGDKATQTDMNECAASTFRHADNELNTLYAQIKARLKDPSMAKHLMAAQRAWLAYRDEECAFAASSVEGGSVYAMIVSSCQEKLTRVRITDFRDYLACQEGDLSCPLPPGPDTAR